MIHEFFCHPVVTFSRPDRPSRQRPGDRTPPGRAAGEEGTVWRRSASATGEPVQVVAIDEEDSALEFYSLADEIEPDV
jgi:hypothetical protein